MNIETLLAILRSITLTGAILSLLCVALFVFLIRIHKPSKLKEVIAELTPDTRPKQPVVTSDVPQATAEAIAALFPQEYKWTAGWQRTPAPWLPEGGRSEDE